MFITVDERPVSEIGPWAIREWTSNLQGPEDLTWIMRPGPPDPLLKPGALVELRDGSSTAWSGILTRPARGSGEIKARGHATQAYETPALDGAGAVTLSLDTAIDAAISRGALHWIRRTSIPNTGITGDNTTITGVPNIGQLLDAYADETSQWWRVTPDRVVEMYAKPTTPRWFVTAEAGTVDIVQGDYASRLYGRRRTSTAGVYATEHIDDTAAEAALGYAEDTVDLTDLGYLTAGKAQSVLTGMLAKGRARPRFANGVRGSRWQILSIGQVPAHLPAIQAGELARFIVQHDETRLLQGRGYIDELIGRVIHTDDPGVVEIQPDNLARGADWRDAVAYMASKRRRK